MSRRTRLALGFGTIGSLGEIALLRHELVNCYPFKMFTYPPWQFYHQLGNTGAVTVGALAVLLVLFLGRRAPLLTPPVATILAPLMYLGLVALLTAAYYGWTVPSGTRNFDDYSVGAATSAFGRTAAELALSGLLVGSICSALIRLATHPDRKSAA